jgi:hypothetical protein
MVRMECKAKINALYVLMEGFVVVLTIIMLEGKTKQDIIIFQSLFHQTTEKPQPIERLSMMLFPW